MNKIIELKFGSHLYGTDTPNSDLDFKAIYLPTAKEIVLNNYQKTICTVRPKQPFERNNKNDVDIEIFSLDRYLELLLQGQTVALDMLFHPNWLQLADVSYHINYQILGKIYNNRFELLNKNVNAFIGYARQQAAKYGVKGFRVAALRQTLQMLNLVDENYKLKELTLLDLWVNESKNEHIKMVDCKGPNGEPTPHLEVCNRKLPLHCTVKHAKQVYGKIFDNYGARALLAERNEGIDWKALSHAVRVNSEAQELLTTGFIIFPRPDRQLLLDIKLGKIDYKEVAEIIEKGLADLEETSKKSTLREKPNKEWADNFIYEIYSEIVKNS